MMKQEFEQLVGREVSPREYEIIEKVYTWHPAINETDGKGQIAQLYKDFGISVIRGMEKVAEHMMRLVEEEKELNKRLTILSQRRRMLAVGNVELEEMVIAVNQAFMKAELPSKFKESIKKMRENDSEGLVDIALKILDLENEAQGRDGNV